MADRLDEERLEILRNWGAGLAMDGREELRAASKAIMILIDEIELLYVDLWHERGAMSQPRETGGQSDPETAEVAPSQGLVRALQNRLKGIRTHASTDAER